MKLYTIRCYYVSMNINYSEQYLIRHIIAFTLIICDCLNYQKLLATCLFLNVIIHTNYHKFKSNLIIIVNHNLAIFNINYII